MNERRIRIRAEVQDRRRCRFHLETQPVEPVDELELEPAHRFLRKLEEVYEKTRRAIEQSEGRVLRLLRRLIHSLESKIGPDEALIRQLRKADVVELVCPPQYQEKWVRRLFRRFIRRQLYYHQRWLIINALLLPVTGFMMVLPGPNVFFGWNAFRLVSHYLAREGARRVRRGLVEVRLTPHRPLLNEAEERKMLA